MPTAGANNWAETAEAASPARSHRVEKVGESLQKSSYLWKVEPDFFFTYVCGLGTLLRPCFESRSKIIQRQVQKRSSIQGQ